MGGIGHAPEGCYRVMNMLSPVTRPSEASEHWLDEVLRCPRSGGLLLRDEGGFQSLATGHRFSVTDEGIPLFAEEFCTPEAAAQKVHYEKISAIYVTNLSYPHTQVYMNYLDDVLRDAVGSQSLGLCAEICCGAGEAFQLFGTYMVRGIGVDISPSMLRAAQKVNADDRFSFVQGDATLLPLASNSLDTVFMLGGIHHVTDRAKLFQEISRVLKPGGRFFFREPVSDFWLWRMLRTIIYRMSPTLDHETERPLLYNETQPFLAEAGLDLQTWRTAGFLGFCFFMNSDVLVFNRLLRFVPGIRALTALAVRLDDWTSKLPGFKRAGLQVVGLARKPLGAAV